MKSNKWINILAAGLVLITGVAACDKADELPRELTLGAPVVTNIAAPEAVATSDVIVNQDDLATGAIRVMAYGFCYATSPSPTTHDATVTAMPESGKLTATLTGLADNTTYYVRAFATLYPTGVVYSPEVEMIVGVVSVPPSR